MLLATRRFNSIHFMIVVITILLIMSSVTGFVSLPQYYYYGSLFFFGLLEVYLGHGLKIGLLSVVVFLLICSASILLNQPPSYFLAWQRLLGFALLVLIVAPLVVCREIFELRRHLLRSILWFCTILSFGSFICFFLDINFFVRNEEVLSIEAGHFSGLFRHSMLLGPIAGLSTIFTFVSYIERSNKRFWLLVISVCSFGSTLLSASRGAVGATIVGLIVSYMCFYRGNLSRGVFLALFVIGLVAALYPLWGNLTDFLIVKQQNNVEAGGTLMSREGIWLIRLSEIRQHPLTGVGFCCVDTGLTYVDTKTGIIEPGSSWLSVFSMTGVFGFLIFLSIFIKSIRRAYRINNKSESCLLCGFLTFFAFHLVIEGYVLASGSFMGLLYWLLLGSIWLNRDAGIISN